MSLRKQDTLKVYLIFGLKLNIYTTIVKKTKIKILNSLWKIDLECFYKII